MTECNHDLEENKHLWLCLEPVDTLFFRDGRPFGPASRATSGLPNPQVLAGALRTEILRCANIDLAQLADCIQNGNQFETAVTQLGGRLGSQIAKTSFRGPYLGRKGKNGKTDSLLYSAPASLRQLDNQALVRLDPLPADQPLPGWTPKSGGMVPLWARNRLALKPLDKIWITHAGMSIFLSGKTPSQTDLVRSDELYGFEDRTGIAIDPDKGLAQEGMLYATRRLVLKTGVRFWAQVEGSAEVLDLLPKQDESRLLPFGGEGRQVSVTSRDLQNSPRAAHPEAVQGSIDGCCLVLATPAFMNGWRPQGIDLLSAAVPGHIPVSGWDLARGGPKPTRFAVRAGSVYFLSTGTDRQLPSGFGDPGETSLGWGEYCKGVWRYASNL